MKSIKKIILTILVFLPMSLNALEIKDLESFNVLVYNLDENKVIYEKNANDKAKIASLTKIATTIVSIENIKDLDKKVTITKEMLESIPWDASVAGLKIGDVLTYRDLLYASMIPSGADATESLAVSLSGSTKEFIKLMNDLAEKLDMKDTYFANTTGLDNDKHYSTTKDMLKLTQYALNNDTFKEIFLTKSYTTTNGIKLSSTLDYYNKKLNTDLSYVQGSKTGYTSKSGLCLETLSNIKETNIITITLGAKDNENRTTHIEDLNKIYEQMNDKLIKINLFKKNDTVLSLETKYAKEEKVKIKANKDISVLSEKKYDKNKLEIKYDGPQIIKYNTKKGTKLGIVKIYYDNELIEEMDVLLQNNLKFSLLNFIKSNIVYIILSLILVVYIRFKIEVKRRKVKRRKHN